MEEKQEETDEAVSRTGVRGRENNLKSISTHSLSTLTVEASGSPEPSGSSGSDDNVSGRRTSRKIKYEDEATMSPKRMKTTVLDTHCKEEEGDEDEAAGEEEEEEPLSGRSEVQSSSSTGRSSSPPLVTTTALPTAATCYSHQETRIPSPQIKAMERAQGLVITKKPQAGGRSAAAAAAANTHKASTPLRKGKWTMEEEMYTSAIIREFERGMLNCAPGTTLRSFLSEKLHCDPMRITKKFAGDASIGKRVFTPCKHTPDTVAEMARVQSELEDMERRFMSHMQRNTLVGGPRPGSNNYSASGSKPRAGSSTRGTTRQAAHHHHESRGGGPIHHFSGSTGGQHLKAGLLLHPGLRATSPPASTCSSSPPRGQQQVAAYELLYNSANHAPSNYKSLPPGSASSRGLITDLDTPVVVDHTGQVVIARERMTDAYGRPLYIPLHQQAPQSNKQLVVPGPAGQLAVHDLSSACFIQPPGRHYSNTSGPRYIRGHTNAPALTPLSSEEDYSMSATALSGQQSGQSYLHQSGMNHYHQLPPPSKRKRKENRLAHEDDDHSTERNGIHSVDEESEAASKEADSRLLLDFFVSVHERTASPEKKARAPVHDTSLPYAAADDSTINRRSRRRRATGDDSDEPR